MRRGMRSLCALAAVAALAGCGGGEEGFEPLGPADTGPVHVHALGVDPADGTLYIATHTGLWKLPAGAARPRRVGTLYQDTMAFTVAGPGRFLGSGHPDLQEARENNLPPHLGLIESTDGGESWRQISLLGEADFHVLRLAGDRLYGYDATNDRLMLSLDGGQTWEERARPAPLYDLVVDPSDPRRLVAASEAGLHVSADGGASWSQLADGTGLLAWPAAERLYLVTAGGLVLASTDAGRSFEQAGALDGEPAALLALDELELYAALHDGSVVRSEDGGATWAARSAP